MRIISGAFKGRSILTLPGPVYRPATSRVREALFSILSSRGVSWEGGRVLDCFAGSGSLGIEALSRGAGQVWFMEKNRKAAGLIKKNICLLNIDPGRYRILCRDLFVLLKNPPAEGFDLIFIDPPYGKGLLLPVLELVSSGGWLADKGLVAAEVEAGLGLEDLELSGLELVVKKVYGQTRIYLWNKKDHV